MSYELEAILGRQSVLEQYRDRYGSARVVPLERGWAIIPLTLKLQRELSRATGAGRRDSPAAEDHAREQLTTWLEEMSRGGVVARIESECFGGVCGDAATVWRGGTIVLGPLRGGVLSDDFTAPLVINQALRFMGFSLEPSDRERPLDEFDAVGLGRHRKTEKWV